ncbi:MAG: hypothetical protein SOY07_08725 [Bacteroidales bacterium]|nr:hypothetical protein [Bacteroidales bacterium]MDY4175356.1 hypothetical protein [Bacteroidales bacterium]
MENVALLNALIAHYTNGSKAKFAALLGLTPQTISTWFKRNSLDAHLIYKKCEGVSGDWLLSGGEGNMHKTTPDQAGREQSEPPAEQGKQTVAPSIGGNIELVEIIRKQAEEIGTLKERLRAAVK